MLTFVVFTLYLIMCYYVADMGCSNTDCCEKTESMEHKGRDGVRCGSRDIGSRPAQESAQPAGLLL